MRVAVALLWAASRRVLGLQAGSAPEDGVRDSAGPEEDDPDDIEMRGWLGQEGMAAVERKAADRQSALSTSLHAMGRLLTSRKADGGPVQLSAVCAQFGLAPDACARAEQYLGRLGHSNSTRVTVRVQGYFSEIIRTDVLFAISLGDLCTRRTSMAGQVYRTDFCKIMKAASTPFERSLADQHALFKFGDRRDANLIDVGFNEIVQGCSAASSYMKPSMSMLTMLQSKYILVVNGNDKATGLNWALASNSVPFMVEPDVESWLLESSLEAWKHYVPVKPDFSDLRKQVEWAKQNNRDALAIARAGKEFMKQFGPEAVETAVEAAVLTAYLDRTTFVTGGGAGSLEGNCPKAP